MLSGLHSFYQQLKHKKKMHFSFGHCPELHYNIEAHVKDNKDCPNIVGSLETGNGAYVYVDFTTGNIH